MNTQPPISVLDTTLRDGTQRRGISLSAQDKVKIAVLLDSFGVHYIEGGWPGSNPKDQEFFSAMKNKSLRNAKLVAFGSTRKKDTDVAQDLNVTALLAAETPTVSIVGKSWDLHIERVLETSQEENERMIFDTVAYLVGRGKEVIFDAEHFFDGYKASPQCAVTMLSAAARAGAAWLVFCDTNGGTLPEEIRTVVTSAISVLRGSGYKGEFGIHTHNDCELAVANAISAVEAGCLQVQGTINGYGERCGNTNLTSLLPTLELKLKRKCVGAAQLLRLRELSLQVSEMVNIPHDTQSPYVGISAFAHKGGIHVAAVEKVAHSYEHISPELVGNTREILVSELSGRGNLRVFSEQRGLGQSVASSKALDEIKRLEAKGYQFESASASLELLLRRSSPEYRPHFEILDIIVLSELGANNEGRVQATVKIRSLGSVYHTAAEGFGPVHAMDAALRKALLPQYPELAMMSLTDYKVRILDPDNATAAITRVMIEAQGNGNTWVTIGCSQNIIEASALALLDSFEHFLQMRQHTVATKEDFNTEPSPSPR
jgi:2-isopropylmalate synthase